MHLSVTLLGLLYRGKKCSTVRIIIKDQMNISLRVLCVCMLCFCWGILETEIRCCTAHCRTEAANEFGKVECGEQGKQVYGMMGDGQQIYALISQLVCIIYFFFFQATSMYLENKYLFEGFMVSIKSGFLKLGHRNRTKILPSGKLTYIFKMYHVVLLIQTELYHWKHFPFGF